MRKAVSSAASKLITSTSMRIKDLPTPAFVINRHAFENNCRSMLKMAKERNLQMRPHVKTHKTSEGAWIQATGCHSAEKADTLVTGFVTSTLPEIEMLVNTASDHAPFRDVLYGVPISESKLEALDLLRRKLGADGQVHIIIDHPTQVAFVEEYIKEKQHVLEEINPRWFSVFLKLDTGYHRAGIACDERGVDLALQILRSPYLDLKGVYSHCGHSYDENESFKQEEIANVDIQLIKSFLVLLKSRLESTEEQKMLNRLTVSIGSTPSARHHTNTVSLPNSVEIHPGNYALFDRQQLWTGACTEPDLAGRVISRVIGHYEDRNTIMLDAGATALTKDATPQGGVCAIGGHAEVFDCYKMSQEMVLVRPKDPNTTFPFQNFALGSIVNLFPNHSCLAAACFDKYHVIDDPSCAFSPDEEIVDEWIPAKYFDITM